MSETPIFNAGVLKELNAELGAENTAEVLNTFLADTARKMSVIASADASRSIIKRESHSIKSSAATFGFERLSQLARQLEAGAEAMEAGALAAAVQTLRRTFAETAGFAETTLLPAMGEIAV